MNSSDPFVGSVLTSIIVVADMEASKHFYLDLLGAESFREYGGDSMVVKFLGTWLLLVTEGGPTEDKPGTVFLPPTDPNSISHSFTIRVDNCETSYQILEKRGVKFLTPPMIKGLETRCFFRDPDGHLFELSEYRK